MNFTDLFEVTDRNEIISKCFEKLKGDLMEAIDTIDDEKRKLSSKVSQKESEIADLAKDMMLAIEVLNPTPINIQMEFNL